MAIVVRRPQVRRVRVAARVVARPAFRARADIQVSARQPAAARFDAPRQLPDFRPDPYVDYGRRLTDAGGIAITYKDIDERFRHTLWRLFAWSCATGFEAWFVVQHSPVANVWVRAACLLAAAIVNWLIVAKPVEIYRTVEIRPDCMIIEGTDIFWSRFMENGWPQFQAGPDGSRALCGIYGTRFVEFLTVRKTDATDQFDRSLDVFAAHLQDAMKQLWIGRR